MLSQSFPSRKSLFGPGTTLGNSVPTCPPLPIARRKLLPDKPPVAAGNGPTTAAAWQAEGQGGQGREPSLESAGGGRLRPCSRRGQRRLRGRGGLQVLPTLHRLWRGERVTICLMLPQSSSLFKSFLPGRTLGAAGIVVMNTPPFIKLLKQGFPDRQSYSSSKVVRLTRPSRSSCWKFSPRSITLSLPRACRISSRSPWISSHAISHPSGLKITP